MSASAAPMAYAGAHAGASARAVCRVRSASVPASASAAKAVAPLAFRAAQRGAGGVPAAAKARQAVRPRRTAVVASADKDRDGTQPPLRLPRALTHHPPASRHQRIIPSRA
jgi:hypothetical protein